MFVSLDASERAVVLRLVGVVGLQDFHICGFNLGYVGCAADAEHLIVGCGGHDVCSS